MLQSVKATKLTTLAANARAYRRTHRSGYGGSRAHHGPNAYGHGHSHANSRARGSRSPWFLLLTK